MVVFERYQGRLASSVGEVGFWVAVNGAPGALVELTRDPVAQGRVGAVGEGEVGAYDPAVLAEGGGERACGEAFCGSS